MNKKNLFSIFACVALTFVPASKYLIQNISDYHSKANEISQNKNSDLISSSKLSLPAPGNNCGLGFYGIVFDFYTGLSTYLGSDFNAIFPKVEPKQNVVPDSFLTDIGNLWAATFKNSFMPTANVTFDSHETFSGNSNAINLVNNAVPATPVVYSNDVAASGVNNLTLFKTLFFSMAQYFGQKLTANWKSSMNQKDYIYDQIFTDYMWTLSSYVADFDQDTITNVLTFKNDKTTSATNCYLISSVLNNFLFKIVQATPDIDQAVMMQKIFGSYFSNVYTYISNNQLKIPNTSILSNSYVLDIAKLPSGYDIKKLKSDTTYGTYTAGNGAPFLIEALQSAYNPNVVHNAVYFQDFLYQSLFLNVSDSSTFGGYFYNILSLQSGIKYNPLVKDASRVLTNTTAGPKNIANFLTSVENLKYQTSYMYTQDSELYQNFNPFFSAIVKYNNTKFVNIDVYEVLLISGCTIVGLIILSFVIWKSYMYFRYNIVWKRKLKDSEI